jgi:integrase
MSLYKRGKIWHFDAYIKGKRIRASLHTDNKFRALELYGQKKRELEEEVSHKKVKFSDFKKQYLNWARTAKKSADREEQRLSKIEDFFSDLGIVYLSDVNPYHIEQFKAWLLEQELSKATINRYLQLLRGFFYRAIDWQVFDGSNPLRKVKFFREVSEIKPLSKTEVEKIIEAAKSISQQPASPLQKVFADLIIFAIHTGLRKSEILFLKWNDLKDDEVQVKGKGEKIRMIPLNAIAKEIIAKQPKRNGYIFDIPNRRQGDLFRRTIEKIKTMTDINWHFHLLRHFFTTQLIEKGVDFITISDLLGHSARMTTLRYSHTDKQRKMKAVESLDANLVTEKQVSPKT